MDWTILLLKGVFLQCYHDMAHKTERIIVLTGTFDPMNLSDVMHIRKAKDQGDWLIVGVHSDLYIKEYKKRNPNESYDLRRNKVSNLKSVDEVFNFIDTDGNAIHLLSLVQICYPGAEIFFVTQDQGITTIPETSVKGVKFLNVNN